MRAGLRRIRTTAAATALVTGVAAVALGGAPHPAGAVTGAAHLSTPAPLPGAGLDLKLIWSKTLPGGTFRSSSPAAATLDADGPSVVVGALNGKVYAYHLGDGSPVAGWPVQLDKPIDSSPAVYDVGDGAYPEIFIGSGTYDSGTGGGYWGITNTGQTALHYTGRDPNQADEPVYATPAVANITCGPDPDVVAGALGQDTYALDGTNGSVVPGWPVFTYDTVYSSPAIAQVGGQTEVFEGGDLTSIKGGVLRAINGAGQVLWTDDFDDVVTSSPAIADVGPNGQPMLAVGSGFYFAQQHLATGDSDQLFLINPANGSIAWSRALGGYTRTSPAFGDLEGTGGEDIVEATQGSKTNPNYGEIDAFDGAGNQLPGWPVLTPPGVGAVIGSVVTADLTGQGYDDVLVPTGDGLYIYDGKTGALAASVAVDQIGMQSSPLVTEDPNGTLGITVAGVNTTSGAGVIFHYEVAGGRIDAGSWPMFRGNPARTGTLAGPSAPAVEATGCGADRGSGYRFVASDGGVFDFGTAGFEGSPAAKGVPSPIVGMAPTTDDQGYWLLARDGAVYSFGDAGHLGSPTGRRGLEAVGIAAAHDGQGYWIVDQHGGVYAYGAARFFGSTGAEKLNQTIVGMASTPDGGGYWLVGSGGAVYGFGDAAAHGSIGTVKLKKPIVGLAGTPDGGGYWLVGSGGAVYGFGDAGSYGSAGALRLSAPVVGLAATPDGKGYWLVASDGGIFSFGDAAFLGSTGAIRLSRPIVGMIAG